METEKKNCNCDKVKQLTKKNCELKKRIIELFGKIERLEKFIKGEK